MAATELKNRKSAKVKAKLVTQNAEESDGDF